MSSTYNPYTEARRKANSMTSGWSIVTDARRGSKLGVGHLVLVDQKLDNSQWWTSDDPTIIMCYRDLHAAVRANKRFYVNNPRVIPYEEAVELVVAQNRQVAMRTLERLGGAECES